MTLAGEQGHARSPDPASWYLHSHNTGTEEPPGPASNVKVVEVTLREPWARGHGREVAQQSLAHHLPRSITLALSPPRSVASAKPALQEGCYSLTLPNLLMNVLPGKGTTNWAARALFPLKRKAEFPGSTCESWIQDPSRTMHLTNPKAHENQRTPQVGRDP